MVQHVDKNCPLLFRAQLLRKGMLLTADQVQRIYLDAEAPSGGRTTAEISTAEAMCPPQAWERDERGYNFSWSIPPTELQKGTTIYTFTFFSDGIANRMFYRIII